MTISLFLVVQQLQGVTHPLLFKWMNENMNEWRRDEESKEQALKSRMKAAVCLSVCCVNSRDQERLLEGNTGTVKQRNKQTLGWNYLVLLYGVQTQQRGGKKPHPGPNPSLLIHLPDSTQRLNLQKKTEQKSQTAQNGLNFIYSVVYTCN